MNCYYISKITHTKKQFILLVSDWVIKYIFIVFFFSNSVIQYSGNLYFIHLNFSFTLSILLNYPVFFHFSSYKILSI